MSTLDGAVRARISNEMVRLHTEYYGRGPTRAKVYVDGDLVAVVLEDTFTPAEKTLIARGESEGIQDIRRRFQRAMADQFRSIVEQATGREVRSFLSETDLDNDISVELFLLGASRTDMTGFEKAGEQPEAGDQDPTSDPGR
jgi:uncharacterized protein YbcI